jgi:hypothetical protein
MIVNCIDNAIAILSGETIEHSVVIPTTIVDRDNVEGFLDPNTPY